MIYLDNSATSGYKPDSVINAVANTMRYLSANPGRSGHTLALRSSLLVHNTREKVAKLFNLDNSERVIFTYNCSDALNTAILGTIKLGGNVITTAYEHNSVLRPLFEMERLKKITLTVIPPNEYGHVSAEMIAKFVRNDTYMVITNHVSNVTGAVTPVAEIGAYCRKHNLLYLVDGAQSCGYMDIDLKEQNIDLLTVACHKGLHAPQGVGCLLIGTGANVSPIRFGGTGTSSSSVYQPQGYPECLESGTLGTPAIAGLNAGIEWTLKHKLEIKEKLTNLSIFTIENLNSIKDIKIYTPKNVFNGIIAFNIGRMHSEHVSNILSEQFDICTRSGLHCAPLIHKHLDTLHQGIVRASLGYENSYANLQHFIDAVREIACN